MSRYLIVFGALLVVGVAVVGFVFFSRSTSPAPSEPIVVPPNTSYVPVSQPVTGAAGAVQSAFQTEITPHDEDNTKLHETAIVGEWALQVWVGDNMGGQALLKYDTMRAEWVVVTWGGGAWSVEGLVAMGVPESTAAALLADLPY